MDRNTCQQFFLQPGENAQRRYEVLRAVFIDDDTALEAAERFQLSHGTVRNWVSQFSAELERGERPPFSKAVAMRRPVESMRTNRRTLPMFKSFPSSQDGDCGHGWRGSFCSCPSWLDSDSTDLWSRPAIPDRRWYLLQARY